MLLYVQNLLCCQCCYCCGTDHSLLWDFFKDFFLPILLALFAGGMAYFIFIEETRRDKRKEKVRKDEERSDKLLFFSALIGKVLKTATSQKEYIREHIEEIKKNDVDFLLMTFLPLYDLKRVTEALNLEEYLLAYVNYYSIDRKKSVKEFEEIISSIDFLFLIYNGVSAQLEKAQKFDHERKLKFQKLFENAHQLVGSLMLSLRNDASLQTELITRFKDFSDNSKGKNDDLPFAYEYFMVPFNTFCLEYINTIESRISKGEEVNQDILNLATITRNGKQLYGEIKWQNQLLKNDLSQDLIKINLALDDLEKASKNIIRDF